MGEGDGVARGRRGSERERGVRGRVPGGHSLRVVVLGLLVRLAAARQKMLRNGLQNVKNRKRMIDCCCSALCPAELRTAA